jgi:ankyrin repeat protein
MQDRFDEYRFILKLEDICNKSENICIKKYLSEIYEKGSINELKHQGTNLIHIACKEGNLEIVKILIKYKNVRNTIINQIDYSNNETPLHIACFNGHIEIVKELFKYGSYMDYPSDKQNLMLKTPLHLACEGGHIEIVKYLMTNSRITKFCLNMKDCFGNTPINIAIGKNYMDICIILLSGNEHNVSVDRKGNTFLHDMCRIPDYNKLEIVLQIDWIRNKLLYQPNYRDEIPLFGGSFITDYRVTTFIMEKFPWTICPEDDFLSEKFKFNFLLEHKKKVNPALLFALFLIWKFKMIHFIKNKNKNENENTNTNKKLFKLFNILDSLPTELQIKIINLIYNIIDKLTISEDVIKLAIKYF